MSGIETLYINIDNMLGKAHSFQFLPTFSEKQDTDCFFLTRKTQGFYVPEYPEITVFFAGKIQ